MVNWNRSNFMKAFDRKASGNPGTNEVNGKAVGGGSATTEVNGKALGSSATNEWSDMLPKNRVSESRFQQIPEYYFLPRRSWAYNIGIYGSLIALGIGAGMIVEVWINKKIQEDGGVVWEFDKK